jgi:hypothetical protein
MAQSAGSRVAVWRAMVLAGSAGTAIGLIGQIPWLGLVAGPLTVVGVVGLLIAQRAPARTAPDPARAPRTVPGSSRTWMLAGAAVVVVAAGAAVVLIQSRQDDEPVKPGAARVPLGFYMTEDVVPGACAGTGPAPEYGTPDGSACVKVAATGGFEVRQLEAVQVRDDPYAGNAWFVAVTFTGADAGRFTDLSRQLSPLPQPRNQLAVVMGSRMISNPAILEPLTSDTAVIVTGLTRAEAEAVAADLGVS